MKTSKDAPDSSGPSEFPEVPEPPRRSVNTPPASVSNAPPIPRGKAINIVAGTLGHFVEWFDWNIYGVMAVIFASQIFPSDSPAASVTLAFATYAIGFLIRPLSGLIISPLADRFGRRGVLALTISLMAGGSLLIGFTPPYAAIGWLAPAMFLTARVAQGISAGSEQQGAIAFMVEHAPANRRALFGSLTNFASGVSILAATGTAALITTTLSKGDLNAWGWRIPFVIGGVLGLIGLVVRARADESPEVDKSAKVKTNSRSRLGSLLRNHPKALLQSAALSAPAVAYYTWSTFLPTYAALTTGQSLASALTANLIGIGVFVVLVPLVGAVSDRIGRRKPFPIIGAIGMVVLFYPLMLLLTNAGFGAYVLVSVSGYVVLAIWQAVYPTIQAELFPAAVRVSGIGLSHQLVIALFGGTAPLIASAFLGAGQPMLVAVYMIVIVGLSLIAYFTLPETGPRRNKPSETVSFKDANAKVAERITS
ncbi:MFS transporter [Arthrobacter sp. NPDC080073]|uniref:MFS transporter n=1 Tax=Arthrobacter sp. NPDC080073 TaxID=3155919 RepID=UPI0034353832